MKIFKIILSTICTVLFVMSVSGTFLLSQTSSTVSGKVVDEDTGKGIKDVQVKLYYGFNYSTAEFSDKNGGFCF